MTSLRRRFARSVSIPMICLMASHLGAQNPAAQRSRTPSVSYGSGLTGAYRAGSVSATDLNNSPRIHELIRAGQLYLSLQDAIALALENNLDLELERYGVRMAATDTLRATGGGTLRGVPLTVNEAPLGLGGPGEPLLTSAATGATPQTTLPVNVTDSALIQETQDNANVTGTFPFSTGPAIPQFDPALVGQFLAQHLTTPETSTVITGTPALVSNTITGNLNYTQAFSLGTQVSAGLQNLRTDSNSTRNLIDPYYNSSLGITITQPLLRGSEWS